MKANGPQNNRFNVIYTVSIYESDFVYPFFTIIHCKKAYRKFDTIRTDDSEPQMKGVEKRKKRHHSWILKFSCASP